MLIFGSQLIFKISIKFLIQSLCTYEIRLECFLTWNLSLTRLSVNLQQLKCNLPCLVACNKLSNIIIRCILLITSSSHLYLIIVVNYRLHVKIGYLRFFHLICSLKYLVNVFWFILSFKND